MDCLHPVMVLRPEFRWLKDIEDMERRKLKYAELDSLRIPYSMQVPCGKCIACLKKRAQDWSFRIRQEALESSSAVFVTLTYDEDHLPYFKHGDYIASGWEKVMKINNYKPLIDIYQGVYKRDIQLFMKRLRKFYDSTKIRYFIGAEYGPTTHRPHYHGIIFNLPWCAETATAKDLADFKECWQNGFVDIKKADGPHIGYCAKYFIGKSFVPKGCPPVFLLSSRNPAIGAVWLFHNGPVKQLRNETFVVDNGVKRAMPKYYRDKLGVHLNQDLDVFDSVNIQTGEVISFEVPKVRDHDEERARVMESNRLRQEKSKRKL